MAKLDSYKISKRFGAAQKPNISYGNRLIEEEDFPSVYPDTGEWILLLQGVSTVTRYRITATVNQGELDIVISDWPEKKDPSTQADLLDHEENEVQELIFRFKTSLSIPYRERLAKRLFNLFNYAKEEDSASLGIALSSLRNFYSFLQLHTNLKYPSITLSPDNNILASWRSKQSQVFSVHFLSNKDVRFVIVKPNKKHPNRKFRFSGAATTDTLMDEIPKDMLDWIT